jgi:hypothetical protein
MSNEENTRAAEAATEVGVDHGTETGDQATSKEGDGESGGFSLEEFLSKLHAEPVKPDAPESAADVVAAINEVGVQLRELLTRVEAQCRLTLDNINYELRDFKGTREELPQHVKDFETSNVGAWLNQASASLATGLMQLCRAVERPTFF